MSINNLKTYKQIDTDKQYSVGKKIAGGFIKGGAKGAGIAGAINTAFPALVPTFAGMAVGASDASLIEKIGAGLGLASAPAVQISGLGILGIGAAAGAIIGTGVALVKHAKYNKIAKEKTR